MLVMSGMVIFNVSREIVSPSNFRTTDITHTRQSWDTSLSCELFVRRQVMPISRLVVYKPLKAESPFRGLCLTW